MSPLLVLGAGAWGTALACVASRAGHQVYLWGRDPAQIDAMARTRENSHYLSGLKFPASVTPISDLAELSCDVVTAILAVPLAATETTIKHALKYRITAFACAAKGMSPEGERLVHEIVHDAVPASTPIALLSGPSFAREVMLDRPTAITIACEQADFGQTMIGYLHTATFRPYLTNDVFGVAVGGAVKNVLAIAAGISDGLGLGVNSRAALITRGLAEITRFGVALGGRMETFMGLAGLGDAILTCTDDLSRNRRFGLAIGRGRLVREAHATIGLVEGAATSEAVLARAARLGVEMPITREVVQTLRGEITPTDAVRNLLARDLPSFTK